MARKNTMNETVQNIVLEITCVIIAISALAPRKAINPSMTRASLSTTYLVLLSCVTRALYFLCLFCLITWCVSKASLRLVPKMDTYIH